MCLWCVWCPFQTRLKPSQLFSVCFLAKGSVSDTPRHSSLSTPTVDWDNSSRQYVTAVWSSLQDVYKREHKKRGEHRDERMESVGLNISPPRFNLKPHTANQGLILLTDHYISSPDYTNVFRPPSQCVLLQCWALWCVASWVAPAISKWLANKMQCHCDCMFLSLICTALLNSLPLLLVWLLHMEACSLSFQTFACDSTFSSLKLDLNSALQSQRYSSLLLSFIHVNTITRSWPQPANVNVFLTK